MTANKYVLGAAALAAKPTAVGREDLDYTQILYDPAGGLYRFLTQAPDRYYNYSAGPNTYWKQQRQQGRSAPGATLAAQRRQQGQQLRDSLLQQQAANTAALRSQFAQMFPGGQGAPVPTGAQPSPPPPGFYRQQQPDESPPDDSALADDTVVGAAPVTSKFPPGNYVVLRVNNMKDVIRQQSALGKLALMGAPKTIEQLAYARMADELKSNMADRGVDADVTVTEQPPSRTSSSDIVTGAVIGGTGVGLVWLLVKLLGRRR